MPHLVELAKQKMTAAEGRRALGEMRVALDRAHVAEVEQKRGALPSA